jgi:hypothetical protein
VGADLITRKQAVPFTIAFFMGAFEGMGNGRQVTVPFPQESPRPDDEDRVCEQLVSGAIAKIEAGQ